MVSYKISSLIFRCALSSSPIIPNDRRRRPVKVNTEKRINDGICETDVEIYGEDMIISEKLISDLNNIDESIKILVMNIFEKGALKILNEDY